MNSPVNDLKFTNDLIPAIVRDAKSGAILTLAYMNEESLQKTIDESARESEVTTGTLEPIFEHSLSVVAVDFAYEERPILSGATLEILAGEVTAIVGPSGAGKTTIADLALGLVKPQSGEVLLTACRCRKSTSPSGVIASVTCRRKCFCCTKT